MPRCEFGEEHSFHDLNEEENEDDDVGKKINNEWRKEERRSTETDKTWMKGRGDKDKRRSEMKGTEKALRNKNGISSVYRSSWWITPGGNRR